MARKKRILLVEPNDTQRMLFSKIAHLEDGVYEVIAVKDAFLALQHLANADRTPDMVVSEFIVPGGGIEFFKSLDKMGIRVMCATGSPLEALRAVKTSRLMIPIIEKPFDVYKMLSSIDSILLTDIRETVVQKHTYDF